MREINPRRSNQFRSLQRGFHSFFIGFQIACDNRVYMVMECNRLTLFTVQHLIKELMDTGIFIMVFVPKSLNIDISALLHM